MKRLGLLVAVEIDAVNELLGSPKWKKEEYGFPVSCYEIKGNELIVIHSNAGELAASEATSVLILEYGVKTIFNFGIVGALTHKIGDTPLVFVKEVVHSDADLSQIDHVPVGQHAGFDTPFIHLDEEYLNLASQVYPDIPLVRCASGDRFVLGEKEKTHLHDLFNADIVEMELAAIVYAAEKFGARVFSCKMVADFVKGGEEEYYANKLSASKTCLSLLLKINELFEKAD